MTRIVAVLLLLPWLAAAADVAIRMEGGAFRVAGWDASGAAPPGGWESVFSLYMGDDVPPMLGSYAVDNGTLVFRPRFPLGASFRVRAVFRAPGGTRADASFSAQSIRSAPASHLQAVYPSTDLLPGNQLKFYLHFSAPMSRGEAWRRIHLLNQSGSAVELPFLEVDQELWDRDYRRLTVLFDPGRIKRGLLPLEEVGPAIEEGKRYTLVIDRDWLDATGTPMRQGFRKEFGVGPPERTPIDPASWKVSSPRAGTSEPLTVDFPRPLDWALLLRLLDVPGVAGSATVDRNETRWIFTPDRPWPAGMHQIVVDTSLEDLAGNRIGRPFDVDTFDRVSKTIDRKTISIPFEVRK